ncbi:MAG: putative RNA methyltransferase [Flavonifractor plautii]
MNGRGPRPCGGPISCHTFHKGERFCGKVSVYLPHLRRPLERGAAYACPNGHAYDKAREGYVHLLPANKKHSKAPGDDKGMAEARRRFLSGGYYGHLLAALCALGAEYAPPGEAVLDSGCGEGYYTAGLWEALGRPPLAGIDLSKPSVRLAARRVPEGEFAVASAYHLPLADASVGLVLNCFSPLALDEFRRVLRRRGLPLCGARRRPPVGAQAGALRPALPQQGGGHPLRGLFLRAGGAGGGGGGRGGGGAARPVPDDPLLLEDPQGGGGAAGRPGRSAGTGLLPRPCVPAQVGAGHWPGFMCCAFNCRGGLFCLSEAIHLLPTSARLMPGWRAFHGNPF